MLSIGNQVAWCLRVEELIPSSAEGKPGLPSLRHGLLACFNAKLHPSNLHVSSSFLCLVPMCQHAFCRPYVVPCGHWTAAHAFCLDFQHHFCKSLVLVHVPLCKTHQYIAKPQNSFWYNIRLFQGKGAISSLLFAKAMKAKNKTWIHLRQWGVQWDSRCCWWCYRLIPLAYLVLETKLQAWLSPPSI